MSLKRARILRDEAREAHAAGLDPALEKQKAKAAARISAENSFSKVAEMLLEKQERKGLAEPPLRQNLRGHFVRIWTMSVAGCLTRSLSTSAISLFLIAGV
ncbi:hypothetical protein [Sphingobium sp. JS3065]|uniref:hypothetical protein n=1 Tax=Sphingobium sp. JS3065 TaxID=2970925 RepID=UPI002B2782A1|nr:hypothetical protein [Sphingobium sp. JS3065]